jgi:hypothetical protein
LALTDRYREDRPANIGHNRSDSSFKYMPRSGLSQLATFYADQIVHAIDAKTPLPLHMS